MIIRKVRMKDYPQLVEMTAMEGWNYRKEDFFSLYETGCSDTLAATEDRSVIGIITVLDYGNV